MLKTLPVLPANTEGTRDGFGGDGSGSRSPAVMREQEMLGLGQAKPPPGSPTRGWGRSLGATKDRGLGQGSCPRLTPRRWSGLAGGRGDPSTQDAPPAPATDPWARPGRDTPAPGQASGSARSLSPPGLVVNAQNYSL